MSPKVLGWIDWNQISKPFVSGIYDIPEMANENLFVSQYKHLDFYNSPINQTAEIWHPAGNHVDA